MCLKWPRICSVCRNNNPVLDSFITYYRVCNKSNTMGATCGTGTANPSVAHEFTPVFNEVRIARCAFSVSLFVLLSLYFVHCVVCPSSIYAFDYPFGIFKQFLIVYKFGVPLSVILHCDMLACNTLNNHVYLFHRLVHNSTVENRRNTL